MSKKGKQVEMNLDTSDDTINEVFQEDVDSRQDVPEEQINEDKELKEDDDEPTPIPLSEQLKTHVDHVLNGDNRTVIGYSILFRETDDTLTEDTDKSDNDESKGGIVTGPGVKHNMATSYPDAINQVILGVHTQSITSEEVGILSVIGNEIHMRIIANSEKGVKEDDLK